MVEQNRELVEGLRREATLLFRPPQGHSLSIVPAHIACAAMLVIATLGTIPVRQMVKAARMLDSEFEIASFEFSGCALPGARDFLLAAGLAQVANYLRLPIFERRKPSDVVTLR